MRPLKRLTIEQLRQRIAQRGVFIPIVRPRGRVAGYRFNPALIELGMRTKP